ncbi:MAG: peptidyl-tRNA hydrolase [Ignavibacteriaceae bacterium]|nr:MAG: aminoacyl-tRNA hydrolase [Chlorobiota bacterium]GJQ32806.1 MAG: peptidyl-tRNA hydrolase [Ignavibacteriaceae bacterium]
MRIVVGLGNPGKKYENTRHNAGFMFLDRFAALNSIQFSPSKYNYYRAEGSLKGNPFVLIKPATYVNLSGNAVKELMSEYPVAPEDVLVVHDELNLPPGGYKIKLKGSDGGHNGIYSIIYTIENDNFPRIRIGIGNDFPAGAMADYVLSPFNRNETELLAKVFDNCTVLTNEFIASGVKGLLDANSKLSKQDQTQSINPGD